MTARQRSYHRRDGNAGEIDRTLRSVGAGEFMEFRPFDYAIPYRGKLYIADAKTTKGKWTKGQLAAKAKLAKHGIDVYRLEDANDVYRMLGLPMLALYE